MLSIAQLIHILLWILLIAIVGSVVFLLVWCFISNRNAKREQKRKKEIADKARKLALEDKEKERGEEE